MNLFDYIKQEVPISSYVETLPQTTGLKSVGNNKYRCNNILAGGTNATSMTIDDDAGYFKMFSHGQESGDVIKLYSLIERTDSMKDAALGLASHMGITVPEEYFVSNSHGTSKTALYTMMEDITQALYDRLVETGDEDAEKAYEWIFARGADEELVATWRLGFFPSDISECRDLLRQFGDDAMLQEVGLFGGRAGTTPLMAGRITFPITTQRGKVISFSSRVVPGVDSLLEDSKYINTANTTIYEKHETFLGQQFIDNTTRNVVICEGNFDVIALNELTDDDTVALATCGTALTPSHAEVLKRFDLENVTIAFDGDKPGRASTKKAIWLANYVKNLDVYLMAEDEDPWDMYENNIPFTITDTIPAIEAVVDIAVEDEDRDEFITWFTQAYKTLEFSDDKAQLLYQAVKASGLRKSFLENKIQEGNQKGTKRARRKTDTEFSLSIYPLLTSLLSLDKTTRRNIAYPLYRKSLISQTMEICGVRTDTDEQAVLCAMGIKGKTPEEVAAKVYALAPEEETYNTHLTSLARNIATSLQHDIAEGNYRPKLTYTQAITFIANGLSAAAPYEQLAFCFDVIAEKIEEE